MESNLTVNNLCKEIALLINNSTTSKQLERIHLLRRLYAAWIQDIIVDIILKEGSFENQDNNVKVRKVDPMNQTCNSIHEINSIKKENIFPCNAANDSNIFVKDLRRSQRKKISTGKKKFIDEFSHNDSIKDNYKLKDKKVNNVKNIIKKRTNAVQFSYLSTIKSKENILQDDNLNITEIKKTSTLIKEIDKHLSRNYNKKYKLKTQIINSKNKKKLTNVKLIDSKKEESNLSTIDSFVSLGDERLNSVIKIEETIETNNKHFLDSNISESFEEIQVSKMNDIGLSRRPVKCAICSKTYMNLHNLQKHLPSHETSPSTKRNTSQFDPVSLAKQCLLLLPNPTDCIPSKYLQTLPFKCLICGKVYKKHYSLKLHVRTHTGERPHMCSVCGKGFFTGNLLTSHMRTHTGEKRHHCSICNKKFCQSFALLYHQRTFHAGVRPYICSCGKGFGTATLLRYHQMKHVGAKSFLCNICSLLFVTPRQLREHKEAVHVQTKRYKCKHCDKMFKRSQGLYRHIKVHSGLKTHVCRECGKGFYQRTNMLTHMRTHTGVKPFSCQLCNRSFSHNGSLKKHYCGVIQAKTIFQI